jgi:predicted DNA-binding protein YlxM (UPF0122 family)
MRGKRLSDDIVRAIYIKRDLQLSIHEIAVDLGISIKAVQNAIKRRVGTEKEETWVNFSSKGELLLLHGLL